MVKLEIYNLIISNLFSFRNFMNDFSLHRGMGEQLSKKCNRSTAYTCYDGHVPSPLPFDCPDLNVSAVCVPSIYS